ncbi:MAG: cytidine deaminase [Bacteroidota bacterium]
MKAIEFKGSAFQYNNAQELAKEDQNLLLQAKAALAASHSPYSQFRVGAAVLLKNGTIVLGSNQENASYPAGVCAERVAMLAANAQFPGEPILKVAITVKHHSKVVATPVGPCGICRQTFLEVESRQNHPIDIILQGEVGAVLIVPGISNLMPLSFTKSDL